MFSPIFLAMARKPRRVYARAIVAALRCCRSGENERKKTENQCSDSNALERERHAGVSASTRRRHVLFGRGGHPVSAQSINVLRLSILFPSVFVLRPARHPTRAAASTSARRSPYGARTLFWSRHTATQQGRIVGSPPGYAAQLLIALPISARARSRTTPPAAGLQTNACPIINCHDPLIGGRDDVFTSSAYLSRLLFLSTFSRQKVTNASFNRFRPSSFALVKIKFFFLPKKEILPYLSLPVSLSLSPVYVVAISLIPRESFLIRSW